jgi:hypothetical protein
LKEAQRFKIPCGEQFVLDLLARGMMAIVNSHHHLGEQFGDLATLRLNGCHSAQLYHSVKL